MDRLYIFLPYHIFVYTWAWISNGRTVMHNNGLFGTVAVGNISDNDVTSECPLEDTGGR